MEEQSFREFISGLSDREARKLSGACQRREARKSSAERECPGNAGLASWYKYIMTMRHKFLNKRLKQAESKVGHCMQLCLDKDTLKLQ